MIPDCYDPAYQSESRERRWDEFAKHSPACGCCERIICPGDYFCEVGKLIVCADCMNDLIENEKILEVV